MRAWFALLLLLGVSLGVVAQDDDIDSLFDDPEAGVIEEEPEETVDVEELTEQDAPSFSGSASAEAGASVGLTDWAISQPLANEIDFAAFYSIGSNVRFDVRPTSATRFFVSLSASAPSSGSVGFGGISIGELFLDYTLADTFFFRVGRQGMTWGNGRLFNPANLASATSGAITLRGFAPIGAGGFTLAAIAKDGYFTDPELPGIAEIGIAGLYEWNLSPFSGSFSGFYQAEAGPATAATIKVPVAGIDIALDGVVDWHPNPSDNSYQGLLSAFWEGTDLGLQLIAEYLFDSRDLPDGLGSTIGIAILATDLLPTWNPGIRWFHALHDGSGELILGADGPVADNLRMSVGVPIAYGEAGSTYRTSTEDPLGRIASLIVRLRFSVSF